MNDLPTWTADGRPLHAASASGVVLVLDEPLSFWGGLDQQTGQIIERRHPQRGKNVAGRVLVMRHGRGSSSSSSVLAEALRSGHGPAAILLAEIDEIVVLGAIVAQLIDAIDCPVVQLDPQAYSRLRTGDEVTVEPRGRVTVWRRS